MNQLQYECGSDPIQFGSFTLLWVTSACYMKAEAESHSPVGFLSTRGPYTPTPPSSDSGPFFQLTFPTTLLKASQRFPPPVIFSSPPAAWQLSPRQRQHLRPLQQRRRGSRTLESPGVRWQSRQGADHPAWLVLAAKCWSSIIITITVIRNSGPVVFWQKMSHGWVNACNNCFL